MVLPLLLDKVIILFGRGNTKKKKKICTCSAMAENLKGEVQRWKRRNDGSGDGLGEITEVGERWCIRRNTRPVMFSKIV